ncbi:hypothetical protein DPMN_085029 [Dreissena polymorpha]|uniref:Uncharacterized protein n=1 Tax=Dreissena polymorpha TaxID=45954 RepID=A0A9D3YCV5_DREPO|nr:hypothetical protein DPMN_085029 [Dreissena polymorpha]
MFNKPFTFSGDARICILADSVEGRALVKKTTATAFEDWLISCRGDHHLSPLCQLFTYRLQSLCFSTTVHSP